MPLFSKKISYLGIDLGSASVKLVELAPVGGKARLVTYGYAEEPTDIIRMETDESEQRMIALIQKVVREAQASSMKAVAALPSFSVFSSIITLPPMKKKEIAQAIQWEAKKFVPMPVNEMVLNWKLVSQEESKNSSSPPLSPPSPGGVISAPISPSQPTGMTLAALSKSGDASPAAPSTTASAGAKKTVGGFTRVLLTAAPKTLVDRYMRIMQGAGLELLSLETESFALERALVGHDASPVMIVDVGSVSCDISIVEGGLPLLTRSIDVGGITITNALVRSLNIDVKRAEQFKRDIGFGSPEEMSGIPKTIETAINPIINEIKYAFDLYSSQRGTVTRIEKIILTGGSSFLPGITEYLGSLLNISVFVGDPWARIMYPVELKPVLDEIGPRFSVAVGLAMREIL